MADPINPTNPSGLQNYQFDIADSGFKPTYFTPEFFNNNQQLFSNWGYDTNNSDWFGKNGYLPTAFMGLQALGGLANAYTGLQQLGLARKQFGFAKDAFNAQLGNSITNYGNAAANARRVAYALQGNYAPNAFGTNSQQQAGENYRKEVTNGMTRSV